MRRSNLWLGLVALAASSVLPGCATLSYYGQSVSGHLNVMAKARPVEEVLDDSRVSPELRERLRLAQALRRFAIVELGLPDNGSYRTYADLGRPYVVWSVFATPEFSLQPQQWCYWFAGCLSYRGYFARTAAEAEARRLKVQHKDVHISGTSAYSTLGWFNDPLLNTMVEQPEAELAYLLFHELAHQRLYIKGDTTFNESFATAVGYEGVRRWFAHKGDSTAYERYRREATRHDQFTRLLIDTRERLATLYSQKLPDATKRQHKQAVFADLQQEYARFKQRWDGYRGYDGFMARELNNSHLALVATYNHYVSAFEALLAENDGDLRRFYGVAARLGKLKPAARGVRLAALSTQPTAD